MSQSAPATPPGDLQLGHGEGALEKTLLVRCVRAWLDPGTTGTVEGMLAGPVEWERLLQLARKHKVSPLVASVLCGPVASACPPDVVATLRSEARALALLGLAASRALLETVGSLRSAGVQLIPYKGPVLAALAYGQPGLREFGDLDVLVHEWDYFLQVDRLLSADRWSRVADFGYERSYLRADQGAVLDVHRSFTDPRFMPFALDFATVVARSIEVPVMGSPVRTLCLEDHLIVLCVQLAKDTAEIRRGPPLVKVCDIAQLVRSHSDIDWDAVVREARRLGVLHVVGLGFAAAETLLGFPMPPEIGRRVARARADDALVRHVVERMFASEARQCTRPELLDPLAWNAAVRERFRDRNRTLVGLRGEAFAPNERDYAYVRLPRGLFRLYRLVKPVRLALGYGRKLTGRTAG